MCMYGTTDRLYHLQGSTSGLSCLMNDVITLSDAMPYDKVVFSLCNHDNNVINMEKKLITIERKNGVKKKSTNE